MYESGREVSEQRPTRCSSCMGIRRTKNSKQKIIKSKTTLPEPAEEKPPPGLANCRL